MAPNSSSNNSKMSQIEDHNHNVLSLQDEKSQNDRRFRSFSFPNARMNDTNDRSCNSLPTSPAHGIRRGKSYFSFRRRDSLKSLSGTEADVYEEECLSESLFHVLTQYNFFSNDEGSSVTGKLRKKFKNYSRCIHSRQASADNERYRGSVSSQGSTPSSPTSRFRMTEHTVSPSQELAESFQSAGSSMKFGAPFTMSSKESSVSFIDSPLTEYRKNYLYQSPRETIRNTNEQIKRNSSGRFGSLIEFAERNHLDTTGKVFANCEESGDRVEPLIDLSLIDLASEEVEDPRDLQVQTTPWEHCEFITFPPEMMR